MRKYLLGFTTFAIAFAILSISVLESASPHYAFAAPSPSSQPTLGTQEITVDYILPYPGRILPDSSFWFLKAIRDKVWLTLTKNHLRRAELSLLFADKRLSMSKTLFERQKAELAFSTLTKAEKYLEMAMFEDDTTYLIKLATASLKHKQVIEEILKVAPEDAKPGIIKIQIYSENIYIQTKNALNSKGITSPINPFDGEK
ncbi:MAG: DUF5667 domain-containing protein [Patescibacteria group bacterium]